MMLWAAIILSALLNTLASVALKHSVSGEGTSTFSVAVAGPVLLSITLYAGAFLSYAFVLRHMSVSIAYPVITGFAALALSGISYFIFNEDFTLKVLLGIFLITLGIKLLI